MQSLGLEMHSAVYAIHGQLTEAEALRLARLVIERIGMTYKYRRDEKTIEIPPHIERFPLNVDGAGGVGESLFQPCFTLIQPLLESYTSYIPGLVGVDTWHEHHHFYLIINSCRAFNGRALRWRLRRMGWKVLDFQQTTCRVTRRRKRGLRGWFKMLWTSLVRF